jgi:hypothetical protein
MLCAAPTAVGMRIRTALDIDDDWRANAGQLAGGLTVRTTAVGRIAKVDAAHEGADPVAHPGGRTAHVDDHASPTPGPSGCARVNASASIDRLDGFDPMTNPHDRVALVTGAGSDIGHVVAHGLLADGSVCPEPRMDLRDAAAAAQHIANLPLSATVLFMTVMATQTPFVGRG